MAGKERIRDTPTCDTAALYCLLSWLSPAYPVGAFSYSSGLEWAVETGDIKDVATLQNWLRALVSHGSGFCDGVFSCKHMRPNARRTTPRCVRSPNSRARLRHRGSATLRRPPRAVRSSIRRSPPGHAASASHQRRVECALQLVECALQRRDGGVNGRMDWSHDDSRSDTRNASGELGGAGPAARGADCCGGRSLGVAGLVHCKNAHFLRKVQHEHRTISGSEE